MQHHIISHWHTFFNTSLSDYQRFCKKFLKFLTLDKLFTPNKQNEWTVWRAEHFVDLVDADVAVCGSFTDRQGQLVLDGNSLFHLEILLSSKN